MKNIFIKGRIPKPFVSWRGTHDMMTNSYVGRMQAQMWSISAGSLYWADMLLERPEPLQWTNEHDGASNGILEMYSTKKTKNKKTKQKKQTNNKKKKKNPKKQNTANN